jgi:hypothetical protein
MTMRVVFSMGCFLAVLATSVITAGCNQPRRYDGDVSAKTASVPTVTPVHVDLESGDFQTVTLFEKVEASKLAASEEFHTIIPLPMGASDDTFVYRIRVRSLAAAEGSLRMRAVWLPEGGWNAMDAAGQQLAHVDLKMVPAVARAGGSFMLQMVKPPKAIELRVFLTNNGDVELKVDELAVLQATKVVSPSAR